MAEISQPEAKAAGDAIAHGSDKVKIGTSFYYIEAGGGIGLKLYWMQESLGSVKFTIDGTLAKVQDINIDARYQRQGLGKVLAACTIGFCEAQGATTFGLGTQDTSGGFWSKFQLSQANTKTITELWIKLGPVIDVPKKPVVNATTGMDRSKKSLW